MILLVFAVAVFARAGWGIYRHHNTTTVALEFPDEAQYWLMATSLADGNGLQDELGFRATRMPLYPTFLSQFTQSIHGMYQARIYQWLIGAIGAVLAAGAATTLFGRRTGLITGLLVAIDPFLIFFSSLLLTETFFVTAVAGLWWCGAKLIIDPERRGTLTWLILGCTAACCVHIRESSLGLVVLLVALIVIATGLRPATLAKAILTILVVVVSLMPWAYRNARVTGEWCWLTTRSGVSLYDGVKPEADGSSDLSGIQDSVAVRGLSEHEWNRHFQTESWRQIRSDPMRIVRLAGVKLARMWNPFPNVGTYQSIGVRIISALWSIPTFALSLLGAMLLIARTKRMGCSLAVYLLLPAIYLSALHSLFVGSVRYRLGALPALHALAAWGLVYLLVLLSRRGAHTVEDIATHHD